MGMEAWEVEAGDESKEGKMLKRANEILGYA